jgi:hypothetical protein
VRAGLRRSRDERAASSANVGWSLGGSCMGVAEVVPPDAPKAGASLRHPETAPTRSQVIPPRFVQGLKVHSQIGAAPGVFSDLKDQFDSRWGDGTESATFLGVRLSRASRDRPCSRRRR